MSNTEAERRLAAIVVADMVGYSRLVEADEKRTLAALKKLHTEVVGPAIARHHGRIVKLIGDGILAEFSSVVAAVAAAVDMQRGIAAEQEDILPERRIAFRIGVNLGDVVVDGDDLLGDGVNVAARLEQICAPGGVLVSGSAHDQLDGKLDITLDPIGEQRVKNISRPIRAYSVRLKDGFAAAPSASKSPPRRVLPWLTAALVFAALTAAGAWWFYPRERATAGPSMVVLPFDNLSDDKEQAYLASGISEDLTTELARVPGLFVLSRTAAFAYKGTDKSPQTIAREMGVRYVLEGSVRRAGEEIRINAQLVDGETGGHLWAERYDGAWADVLALQDKVVNRVALALELRLVFADLDTSPGSTRNVDAYDAFLQASELEERGGPADLASAAKFLERATTLDPDYGQAHGLLAWIYREAFGKGQFEEAMGLGHMEIGRRGVSHLASAMQHPSSLGYQLSGDIHVGHWQSDAAIADLERAIALNPSDVWNYRIMARTYALAGRAEEAKQYLDSALRLDPRPHRHADLSIALVEFTLAHYAQSAAVLEKLVGPDELGYGGLAVLLASYGQSGDVANTARVKAMLERAAQEAGDTNLTGLLLEPEIPFVRPEDNRRFIEGLVKAEIPEVPFGFDPKSSDRLSGDEIKALMFGHTIRGHVMRSVSAEVGKPQTTGTEGDFKAGVPWSVTTTADGVTSYRWGKITDSGGGAHFAGDIGCFYFPATSACAAIFRNPSGKPETQDEYIWLHHWFLIEFSVVR